MFVSLAGFVVNYSLTTGQCLPWTSNSSRLSSEQSTNSDCFRWIVFELLGASFSLTNFLRRSVILFSPSSWMDSSNEEKGTGYKVIPWVFSTWTATNWAFDFPRFLITSSIDDSFFLALISRGPQEEFNPTSLNNGLSIFSNASSKKNRRPAKSKPIMIAMMVTRSTNHTLE